MKTETVELKTIVVDAAHSAGELVCVLFQAYEHGSGRLSNVPGLLKRVIQEGAWRAYSLQHSIVLRKYDTFPEFAEKVLRATIPELKAVCEFYKDMEAVDLIDQVTQNPNGKHLSPIYNINSIAQPKGTSSAYSLRRLRKSRPDLHTKVLAGELSPNKAMIEAGFRVKTFTIKADTDSTIKAIRRHFDLAQRIEIGRSLIEG